MFVKGDAFCTVEIVHTREYDGTIQLDVEFFREVHFYNENVAIAYTALARIIGAELS